MGKGNIRKSPMRSFSAHCLNRYETNTLRCAWIHQNTPINSTKYSVPYCVRFSYTEDSAEASSSAQWHSQTEQGALLLTCPGQCLSPEHHYPCLTVPEVQEWVWEAQRHWDVLISRVRNSSWDHTCLSLYLEKLLLSFLRVQERVHSATDFTS
jgi:hypothetical protein